MIRRVVCSLEEALQSGGALIAIDRKTQRVIGSSRFHGYDREPSEIEIGWTFLARSHWGGAYNGEMKRLMLSHAFKFVDNVIFSIGSNNLRSQRAVEKIGGVRIGGRTETLTTDDADRKTDLIRCATAPCGLAHARHCPYSRLTLVRKAVRDIPRPPPDGARRRVARRSSHLH